MGALVAAQFIGAMLSSIGEQLTTLARVTAVTGAFERIGNTGFRVTSSYKSRLSGIAAALPGLIEAAIAQTVEDIADDARGRAPVSTGRLRDSIEAFTDGAAGVVVAQQFYAHMVEFGTVQVPPRPFMVPAAEAGRAAFKARMSAAIRAAANTG